MSYGTDSRFASKKALKDAIAARGADNVGVFGTSMFGSETATTIAELAGTSAVIVGPDVYNDRRWYANVIRKSDGTITIT
jgi:predicted esterase YcpF (UPF0227 family)